MRDQNTSPTRPADVAAKSALEHLSSRYIVVGSRRILEWHFWLAVGLFAGFMLGLIALVRIDRIPVTTASDIVIESHADTFVREDRASRNYGSSSRVESDGSPRKIGYMKFDLAQAAGVQIDQAVLRMYVTNSTSGTPGICETDTNWGEQTMTYNPHPSCMGSDIASVADASQRNTWVTVDLTDFVRARAGSEISLRLHQSHSNGFHVNSRNSSNPPQIVIATSGGSAPPPPPPEDPPEGGDDVTLDSIDQDWDVVNGGSGMAFDPVDSRFFYGVSDDDGEGGGYRVWAYEVDNVDNPTSATRRARFTTSSGWGTDTEGIFFIDIGGTWYLAVWANGNDQVRIYDRPNLQSGQSDQVMNMGSVRATWSPSNGLGSGNAESIRYNRWEDRIYGIQSRGDNSQINDNDRGLWKSATGWKNASLGNLPSTQMSKVNNGAFVTRPQNETSIPNANGDMDFISEHIMVVAGVAGSSSTKNDFVMVYLKSAEQTWDERFGSSSTHWPDKTLGQTTRVNEHIAVNADKSYLIAGPELRTANSSLVHYTTSGSSGGETPPPPPPPSGTQTLERRVQFGADDAEERLSNGSMNLTSSDLELIRDGSNDQLVGIHFRDISIPQGSTIVNATIEFEVDETSSETTSLTIQAQASDNASNFGTATGNISKRARTNAAVSWNVNAWSTKSEKKTTPNLATVVQEVIDRPGWTSGNRMTFIISGTGRRVAESYNGESANAPLLRIEWGDSGGSAPPPSGGSRGPQSVSCSGVDIFVGDNWQSKVNNNASGTIFCIQPGRHVRQSVEPKSNQQFVGLLGAVMDGENATDNAFLGTGADNVVIKNLVIENYSNSHKKAAIERGSGSSDWIIEHNEIRNNTEIGVNVTSRWQLLRNVIHNNGRYGIHGSGSDVLVEDNEIHTNSTIIGQTGDSGAMKFVKTNNMIVRNNYFHDNIGNGIWLDIDNKDALIEGNTSNNNMRQGIFYEISCGAIIRNNHVEGNGWGNTRNFPDIMAENTGIAVANSPNVEIYGNTVINNKKGIGARNWDHPNLGSVTKCTPEVRNLHVHDNSVTHTGDGVAGITAPKDASSVYNSWNNRFTNNTYNIDSSARFRWDNSWLSYSQWQAEGLQ